MKKSEKALLVVKIIIWALITALCSVLSFVFFISLILEGSKWTWFFIVPFVSMIAAIFRIVLISKKLKNASKNTLVSDNNDNSVDVQDYPPASTPQNNINLNYITDFSESTFELNIYVSDTDSQKDKPYPQSQQTNIKSNTFNNGNNYAKQNTVIKPEHRHTLPYQGTDSCIVMQTDFDIEIDKLKSKKKSIAFFDDYGVLYDVFPKDESKSLYDQREIAYSAEYIVIMNEVYDTYNADDIRSIPVPHYLRENNSVTSQLEYILRMHRKRTDDAALEVAIAEKTIELMKCSKIFYFEKDYLTLLTAIMKVGEFKKADALYSDIVKYLDAEYNKHNILKDTVQTGKRYNNEDYQYLKKQMQKRWSQLQEYTRIKEILPDNVPASYSGYARMKSMNTKNYQKLILLAEEKGINIDN